MSWLVVKMLTVLVSTIFNSQIFLLKKMRVAFAKATHIFSAKILAYFPYLMIKVLTIHKLMAYLVLNNWALMFNITYGFFWISKSHSTQASRDPMIARFPPGPATFFSEIVNEIFSTVILSLPLIQKGQLSVSGGRMCTSTG